MKIKFILQLLTQSLSGRHTPNLIENRWTIFRWIMQRNRLIWVPYYESIKKTAQTNGTTICFSFPLKRSCLGNESHATHINWIASAVTATPSHEILIQALVPSLEFPVPLLQHEIGLLGHRIRSSQGLWHHRRLVDTPPYIDRDQISWYLCSSGPQKARLHASALCSTTEAINCIYSWFLVTNRQEMTMAYYKCYYSSCSEKLNKHEESLG
jgi:hypothetical protein